MKELMMIVENKFLVESDHKMNATERVNGRKAYRVSFLTPTIQYTIMLIS